MTKRYNKPLTPEQMANCSDADIDYSDIPELDKDFWKRATVTPPRAMPNVSLRVTEDVIEFFKAENPKGYTARMAAVLAAYVQAHQTS